jgi:hypothetical protein
VLRSETGSENQQREVDLLGLSNSGVPPKMENEGEHRVRKNILIH